MRPSYFKGFLCKRKTFIYLYSYYINFGWCYYATIKTVFPNET